MLTPSRLHRSVGRGLTARTTLGPNASGNAWAALLDDLAHNGLPSNGPLRDRLAAEPDAGAAGAIALALRRACEINYLVTDEVRAIAADLLDRQNADGGFAGAASTACAFGALLAAADLAACSAQDLAERLHAGAVRAAGALERAELDALGAAIALAQGAGSKLLDDHAMWEAVNSAEGRRSPAVRAVLQGAGLLGSRRAA